jgi:cation diffusion facilitator CzcD-associated flavoprotein CzcO
VTADVLKSSYSSKDTPVFGRDGFNLDDIYTPGPQSYLGVTVPNMPNYFMFLGPASAPASGSFIPSLETIAEYIIQCVKKLQKEYYGSLEPT